MFSILISHKCRTRSHTLARTLSHTCTHSLTHLRAHTHAHPRTFACYSSSYFSLLRSHDTDTQKSFRYLSLRPHPQGNLLTRKASAFPTLSNEKQEERKSLLSSLLVCHQCELSLGKHQEFFLLKNTSSHRCSADSETFLFFSLVLRLVAQYPVE